MSYLPLMLQQLSRSLAAAWRVGRWSLLGAVLFPMAGQADNAPSKGVEALFVRYCFDCHGDGVSKGDVALDDLLKKPAPQEWVKVWTLVRHEFMPPANKERPTPAERKAMLEWMEREVFKVDFRNPDPGRVTIRRLNRMEYDYTIEDLFGLKLNVAEKLPPDDTAFGFDNIGDVQTLSPALLETYFDIAENVVSRVIVQGPPPAPKIELNRAEFKLVKATDSLKTEQAASFELKHEGLYRVSVQFSLGGWNEFGGAYDFNFLFDDKNLAHDEVAVGGDKVYRYTKEITVGQGRHSVRLNTLPTTRGNTGAPNHLALNPILRIEGPLNAGIYEYPKSHQRIFFNGPAPSDPAKKREYAREILRRLADRAFHRPVDKSSLERLTLLALQVESFEAGVGQAISAILTSPRFLYREELQPNPDNPKKQHRIDELALASRLSYLLWLSMPDEELTRLATEGKLRGQLKPQIGRMLADKKSQRFFEDFAGQWLRTRNILLSPISGPKTQAKIDPLRPLLKRETELLFEHVAREDRDLVELLTADYTFLNERLAGFYGVAGVKGEEMRRVSLDASTHRGGILTHGSLLIASSNPNRTSPVKRGVFVLENILGTQPPPPPPNIPELEEAKKAGLSLKTLREQLAVHREKASCAACHAHFDPIGLALENFSHLGEWREQENEEKIDASSTLVSGQTISGLDDLRGALVSQKEKFYRCISEKLLTYSLGRGLEPYDAVTVEKITATMMAENGRFSTLLENVVESVPFQMRRGDEGRPKPPLQKQKLPTRVDPRRAFGPRTNAVAAPTP